MKLRDLSHFNHVQFSTRLLLVMLGFFVFSPISSVITMDILRLPLALPELLFIPFFLLLRHRLKLRTFNQALLWLIPAFVILLIISFLLHEFRFSSILSTSRGYFYMILSFSIFKGKNETSIHDIYLVSYGATMGWCLLSVINFIDISGQTQAGSSIVVYGNMIALSLIFIIPIIYRQNKKLLFSIILGIILSLTTGLRRQIIIFVLSVAVSYLFLFDWNISRILKALGVLAITLILLSFSFNPIENFIRERSPLLHYRVFTRTRQFLTGQYKSSDTYRSKTIKEYTAKISSYFFPRGFVSKRTMQDKNAGFYMDFPFIELSYMLGIFILALFIISYFFYAFRHIIYFYSDKFNESAVWAISGFILLVLLFIEGTFLNYSFITPFTGMVLGKLYTSKTQMSEVLD
jgi:hypothetical protein